MRHEKITLKNVMDKGTCSKPNNISVSSSAIANSYFPPTDSTVHLGILVLKRADLTANMTVSNKLPPKSRTNTSI
jgi:hypothetical protein